MILSSFGILSSSRPDPDAQSFITTAGLTDPTQIYAIEYLTWGLKNYSLWTSLDAIYPFIGSTATTQKWNLKNPADTDGAYRLTFNGGWTHSSTGALGNGTNTYANTFYSTSSLVQNDTSMGFYARVNYTPDGGGDIDMGAFNETTGNGLFLAAEIVSDLPRLRMYANACDSTGTNQQGFWAGAAGSDTRLFKNGSVLTTIANSGTFPLTTGNIFLGAIRQLQGAGQNYYTAQEYAFAFIGKNLTNTQVSDLNLVVQQYQTILSRNV